MAAGNTAAAAAQNGAVTDEIACQIKTPHNARLYQENQKLKAMINDLVEYQIAHPRTEHAGTNAVSDSEREVQIQIAMKEKRMRAQLAIIKTLYRQSVMKVREEKALTAESRNVNDALILQLHNLKYEERSLLSEISAAQNFE
jgi:THO complex subunit 5